MSVCELGSISRASSKARIAQPALSRQIKMLESEIGAPLFVRHSAGIRLTPVGELLLSTITEPLKALEGAFGDVQKQSSTNRRRVRLGFSPAIGCELARRLMSRVSSDLPTVALRISEGYEAELSDAIVRGEIDAAVMHETTSPGTHLAVSLLFSEPFVLLGPRDARLSLEQRCNIEVLAGKPLILPGKSHRLRSVIQEAATAANVALNVTCEVESPSSVKEMVESGLGWSVLTLTSIHREYREGRLACAVLDGPGLAQNIVLALPPGVQSTRATSSVLALLKDEISKLANLEGYGSHGDIWVKAA